jgi:hypothetical protein
MKMTTITINLEPEWADIDTVTALTGIPDNEIRRLFNDHKIRARKGDPNRPNTWTVFNVRDVKAWLENEASEPNPFKLPTAAP